MNMKILAAAVMTLALSTPVKSFAIDGNYLVINMYGRQGYTVTIDGKEYTPTDDAIQVFLPSGKHSCCFSAELRIAETQTIEITPGERTRIDAPYLLWEQGTLLLNYMPEGAMIIADGFYPGKSEFTGVGGFSGYSAFSSSDKQTVPFAKDLSVGHYKCLIFKQGYETEFVEFDISKGETTEITGKLKRLPVTQEFNPFHAGYYLAGRHPDFDNYKTLVVIDPDEWDYKEAMSKLKEMAENGDCKALIHFARATSTPEDRYWALQHLLASGNAGDAEAMLEYAELNWDLNIIKQQEYRKKAADLGSAQACFNIIYEVWIDDVDIYNILGGLGAGSDYQIYRDKGADLGHIGCMYWKAEDICKENPEEAFQLYLKCSEAGCVETMNNLAYMYYMGVGTDRDPTEGRKWAQLAADKGDVWTKEFLAGKQPLYKVSIVGTDRMMPSINEFEPYRGQP